MTKMIQTHSSEGNRDGLSLRRRKNRRRRIPVLELQKQGTSPLQSTAQKSMKNLMKMGSAAPSGRNRCPEPHLCFLQSTAQKRRNFPDSNSPIARPIKKMMESGDRDIYLRS